MFSAMVEWKGERKTLSSSLELRGESGERCWPFRGMALGLLG